MKKYVYSINKTTKWKDRYYLEVEKMTTLANIQNREAEVITTTYDSSEEFEKALQESIKRSKGEF